MNLMMTNLTKKMATVLFYLLICCFWTSGTFGQPVNVNKLFINVGAFEADLLQRATVDPTIVRNKYVRVNFGLLSGQILSKGEGAGSMILNLFDDVSLTATKDYLERRSETQYTWFGKIEGVEHSRVILVVEDGVMAGNITVNGGMFQVRYVGDGIHAIYEIDQSAFPDEAPPIPVETEPGISDLISFPAPLDDGATLDVLVVYTAAAETGAGGATAMRTLIQLGIDEANTAYNNSDVNQRLRLVHSAQVSYTETGTASTDLIRLRNPSDGYIDNVHSLRDAYGADAVSFWVESLDACGIGYLMTSVSSSFAPYAFSVIARSCATGNYSFGHELGHNMGAHHDRYVTTDRGAYDYSYGFVYFPGRWRTVMAYNNQCTALGSSCTRIPYFSNPRVLYYGIPTGVLETQPDSANNALTFNHTAFTVANFRQSISDWTYIPGSTPSPPSLGNNPGTGKLHMVVRASNHSLWTSTFSSNGTFDHNWSSIPGATPSTPALAWHFGANKLLMVVRGADSSLWAASFNSSGTFENNWVSIPGSTPSAPALASNGLTGKVHIVVRGADSSLWAASFNSSGTFENNWVPIPGNTPSAPAIVWNSNAGKIQIIVRASDHSLWTATFSANGTFDRNWTSIPGATPSTPTLAENNSISNPVQMIIQASDNSLWTASFNSSGVFNNNWTVLSGLSPSSPGMRYLDSNAVDRLIIVVRGSDSSLWHRTYYSP